ncbi:ROK family transcriptional regulator [Herbiconiux sp. P16]|uniref:ROK family transcriptional regulator n=1 Tax=Herbiconiux wuyangfengii TaxID=3342794 RepID=UPI0035B9BD98
MSSGPGDVLQLVRRDEANTRRDIQDLTGLSRVTVAQRVDSLIDAHLIKESGGGAATGGRRPNRLVFDVQHSTLAVATIDTAHSRTAITDLSGRILDHETVDVAIVEGPEAVLTALASSILRLLERNGIDLSRVAGTGVSVPGPVDPKSRRPSQPPIMPGWDAYPIADHLAQSIPVPTFVENDADAMAFGEQSTGFADSNALCLVKVSTGIGSGLVLGGSVYHGIDGGAGDIGHIRLAGVDALCQCGSRGCLAAVASGRAVAMELAERGVPARSGRDVGALLAAGNVDALDLTHRAGQRIGEVMATVVSMVNPGVLVVSGDLASSALLGGLRETLYPRSLARATRNLDVRLSSLGEDAGLIGLARIVTDSLYSADAVNARLA